MIAIESIRISLSAAAIGPRGWRMFTGERLQPSSSSVGVGHSADPPRMSRFIYIRPPFTFAPRNRSLDLDQHKVLFCEGGNWPHPWLFGPEDRSAMSVSGHWRLSKPVASEQVCQCHCLH